jgi:hypothetical protein
MLPAGWAVVCGFSTSTSRLPNGLCGGPRLDTSLQLERTFGGIALVLLGSLAYPSDENRFLSFWK